MDYPHDDKLEKTLLATLLAHSEAVITVCPFLPPPAVYNARFRAGYTGIHTLYQKHQPVSPATVADMLLELGGDLYTQSGGLEFLQELSQNGVEPALAAPRLAEAIRDHWLRRRQMDWAEEVKKQAVDRSISLTDRLTQARQGLHEIERETITDGSTVSFTDSLDIYLNILDDNANNQDKPKLSLPWTGFKRLMPSFPPGTLVGVLGPEGGGKTSLLECISEQWCKDSWRGHYFHMEDSRVVKLHRRMARWSGVPFKVLQDGGLDSNQWKSVMNVSDMLSRWPGELNYTHCPGWTMGQVVAKAEQVAEAGNLDFIVIDYLNKVRLDDRGQRLNFTQSRGRDIEDFKSFLERYGLVGFLGGQYDKESKKSKGLKELTDLRDSAELADKAQVGLIINLSRRPASEKLKQGKYYEQCQILVDKCNFGQTGAVDMRLVGRRFMFTDDLNWNEEVNDDNT